MYFFFSSRRRHTRCALVTGFQTCALPISRPVDSREVAEALLILQHSAFHEARSTRRCAPLSAFQSHAPLDDRRFRLSSPPANNCRRKNPPRHHGRRHSPGHNRCPSSAWSARSECSAAASAIPCRGRISMRPFALHKPHSTWERWRSEEHTSELQSLMRSSYAVFCLKKKSKKR